MNRRNTTALVAGLVAAGAMSVTACAADDGAQTSATSSTGTVSTAVSTESSATTADQVETRPADVTTPPGVTTPVATDTEAPTATAATTTPAASGSDACSSAAAGPFATIAANSSVGYQIVSPIVFDRVDCVGTTAVAHTAPDGVHQPTGVLFVFTGGQWIAVGVGSAMDCVALGASADDAAQLEGCL